MVRNQSDFEGGQNENLTGQDEHPCSVRKMQRLKNGSPLRAFVVDCLIEDTTDERDRAHFIKNLLREGCVQGQVTKLIYAKDIQAFFDRFQPDIQALRRVYEVETGQRVRLVGDDEKQGLSWFAFECVTAQLAKELKIV